MVDRRTFAQHAWAECTYGLTWPEAEVTVSSTMRLDVTAEGYNVVIEVDAFDGSDQVSRREWTEHVPR